MERPGLVHSVYQAVVLNMGGRVGAWLSDLLLYILGFAIFFQYFYAMWPGFIIAASMLRLNLTDTCVLVSN